MYISEETPEQTENRLLNVIKKAKLQCYDMTYAFQECWLHEIKERFREDALAVVRDDTTWSQLVPSTDTSLELFRVVRFHFEPEQDNSGFVGWLATILKQKLGTGVFVVCGQNSAHGGIYDYWGCPASLGDAFIEEIRKLQKSHFNN